VYFVPLGDFPVDMTVALANYYHATYDLRIPTLDVVPVGEEARSEIADALVIDLALALVTKTYPQLAGDPNAILIALTSDYLHNRNVEDWGAVPFSWREDDQFAIVSTAEMTQLVPRDRPDAAATRLRKVVTKTIGIMYYGLAVNDDPRSVLYEDGQTWLDDLDRMTEEFYPEPDTQAVVKVDPAMEEALATRLLTLSDEPPGWQPFRDDFPSDCRGYYVEMVTPAVAKSVGFFRAEDAQFPVVVAWAWAFSSEHEAQQLLGGLVASAHCVPFMEDATGMSAHDSDYDVTSSDVGDVGVAVQTRADMADGAPLLLTGVHFRVGTVVASIVHLSEEGIEQEYVDALARQLEQQLREIL
jgi:hypothetical protein